jgi:outer membrane protein assembly factor BamB
VYAEPLVVNGVVVVATEHDTTYAFDASNGRLIWRNRLGSPVAGGALPCGDIDPSGITSTPAVDAGRGIVYEVAFESGFHHVLYALSVDSGRVRWSRNVDPPGVSPSVEQQRSALSLANGRVYVPYGGLDGDCGDYHGVVMGVPSAGPSGAALSYQVPSPREGGIWAPSGLAIDRAGNLYIATGNGSSSRFDYGNSVIKVSAGMQMLGFFAPTDAGALNQSDTDLGSTGPVLLPNSRVFIIGKSGIGYLLNRDQLGGLGHPVATARVCGSAFGGVAYAGGVLYVPCTDGLAAVAVSASVLSVAWRQSAAKEPPIVAGAGIWAVGGDELYQLDPRTGEIKFSTTIGTPASFSTPAAAGNRIYVAAGKRVLAFG